jgi:lipopolysaccharide transport system permease protein
MQGMIKDILTHRDLLWILVLRNIKIRYKDSALGFFWTLLGPVLLIVIYALFLGIIRFPIALPVLVTGIFVWQYLAMCLGDSTHAVIGNANLIKKAAFPRIVLPLAMALANLINFLLSLIVVIAYLIVYAVMHHDPTLLGNSSALLWLPLIVLTHVALCAGVSFMLSAVNVFFRDVQHVIGVLSMAWFFLTPVIYPVDMVTHLFERPGLLPSLALTGFFLNPMTGLLIAYREALIGVHLPAQAAGMLLPSLALSWLILLVGILVFQRVQKRFADEL